uniref:Uncharacterized protein n=1 Tax=Arundo donax TaxID=35708 RepID=A0A0A9HFI1_ARUDO
MPRLLSTSFLYTWKWEHFIPHVYVLSYNEHIIEQKHGLFCVIGKKKTQVPVKNSTNSIRTKLTQNSKIVSR